MMMEPAESPFQPLPADTPATGLLRREISGGWVAVPMVALIGFLIWITGVKIVFTVRLGLVCLIYLAWVMPLYLDRRILKRLQSRYKKRKFRYRFIEYLNRGVVLLAGVPLFLGAQQGLIPEFTRMITGLLLYWWPLVAIYYVDIWFKMFLRIKGEHPSPQDLLRFEASLLIVFLLGGYWIVRDGIPGPITATLPARLDQSPTVLFLLISAVMMVMIHYSLRHRFVQSIGRDGSPGSPGRDSTG